ncbi:type II toxin-antitoxin system RelE/ParE family toxin [Rubellimicrobium roseum]|uniref:Type II toxin-antitoxin system RelE/ParE family toxin n=1 Tax=Rubellimicrobium roseum TaxID=687525 RepID=A0A5C4NA31_9RHOB|nr:type II toxin-antitoxin system RelE/ParE family toxin [Rubellimicrobium roseum]TNC71473.1 type II toxin-antitoxin system RelE/ParE family toxin [Rubellimicrobium roseum]
MAYRLLPAALADLEVISLHIAADNPRAARRWLDRIEERCARLAELPGLGVARPDIRSDLRFWPEGSYLLLYRQTGEDVEFVRILHGARQWEDLL